MRKTDIKYLYTKNQKIFGELKYVKRIFSEYKKHFHMDFGLVLIEDGELNITYGKDKIKHLDNNSIAIFNPLQIHLTKVSYAKGYYVLFLNREWCKALNKNFYIPKNILKDRNLYQHFKELFIKILGKEDSAIESEVSKIMQDFFQKYGSCYIDDESSKIKKIKRIINLNSDTSFSVNHLAKQVGYEKTYLIRFFKKEVGMTPQQYILNCKVNRAKDLLTNMKKESLSIISVNSGFFDQSHLNRNFKSLFGENPNSYKHVNIIQDKFFCV